MSGVRTYFHYADEGLIGEYDSTGNEIKTYGYKPGSTWTTDPLFMKEGSSYYFYHNDHLGTPQKMTAVNGAVVWSAKYSSFGEATVDAASTVTNPLRFPGQFFDAETGLHYNYYRYYCHITGRYSKSDPAGIMKGTNHLYAYAKNKPLLYLDPFGLKCSVVDSVTKHIKMLLEFEVVWGDWIYDFEIKFLSKCWCLFYRDGTEYYNRTDTYEAHQALECEKIDECGNKFKYYEFKVDTYKITDEYSKYAGRQTDWRSGWTSNTNDNVDSGGVCSCKPMYPLPPGYYSRERFNKK